MSILFIHQDFPGQVRHLALALQAASHRWTLVNRHPQPCRGYHVFMPALPDIQRQRPDALVLVVGDDCVRRIAPAPAKGSTEDGVNGTLVDFFDASVNGRAL